MSKMYLAVLGRQSEISIAELEALFCEVSFLTSQLATFKADKTPDINRLGGALKIAQKIEKPILEYLAELPDGKITFGISDFSKNASPKSANLEAMKLKKILVRHGRSVRVVRGDAAVLSTATSLHNGLSGKNPRKLELIKHNNDWYQVIGVQDIDAYARRDQARPARDAKVGMLPPKLAQILINLNGDLSQNSENTKDAGGRAPRILDPFCGTGVVLQEALLMGYSAYGTDIDARMIDFSERNLKHFKFKDFLVEQGDATDYVWQKPIDAIACECYLGRPFSKIPSEMELREQKQICESIILKFLKNLAEQISPSTPATIAIPAWLRTDGAYLRLNILDEITDMGYNVSNKSREGLLYHREGQVVARDIIILRKV